MDFAVLKPEEREVANCMILAVRCARFSRSNGPDRVKRVVAGGGGVSKFHRQRLLLKYECRFKLEGLRSLCKSFRTREGFIVEVSRMTFRRVIVNVSLMAHFERQSCGSKGDRRGMT